MLFQLLREAAEEVGDRAIVVSHDGAELTYGACATRAASFARGIQASGVDRLGVAVSDPAEVVPLLAACAAVGVEACTYPASTGDGVRELACALDHEVVVADPDLDVASPTVVTVDALAARGGGDVAFSDRSPLLILTTGTTGHPKAARHDWARLVGATRRYDDQAGSRWLLAYNLNQFAGVQVLLHVIMNRATLVVARSNQPRDAVVALVERGVTHASATPTFWRFVVNLLDEDVARSLALQQVTVGGEAVSDRLLADLARLFPEVSITQIYGSTELGNRVSVRDAKPGLPISVLERPDDADIRFRIVDGELQARSRIGMLGYYGEGDVADGWRPTGDLVEVRGDRIHFVGRRTETINVGGVKVHPLPIEQRILDVEGVAMARVYGRPNPLTGNIVAVDVVLRPGADPQATQSSIVEATSALPRAAQPRRIKIVPDLEVRENKLARGPRRAP